MNSEIGKMLKELNKMHAVLKEDQESKIYLSLKYFLLLKKINIQR